MNEEVSKVLFANGERQFFILDADGCLLEICPDFESFPLVLDIKKTRFMKRKLTVLITSMALCIMWIWKTTLFLPDERSQERVSGRPYRLDGAIWKAFPYRFVSFRPLLGFQERAFAKHR